MNNPPKINGETLKPPRVLALSFTSIVTRLLSGVMIGIMLLCVLPLAVPYIDDAMSFGYIRAALAVEQAIETSIRQTIPTRYGGKDVTRVIIIVAALLASGLLNRISERFQGQSDYIDSKMAVDAWKAQFGLTDRHVILNPLTRKLELMRTAKSRDRERLLKDFAETKRQLDAMGRDLTFLSIDVVDSMGVKADEERAAVEHDFKEFKRLVERTLLARGALKSAWTPDGVMCCFTAVDAAVRAGQEVIVALDRFNHEVKTLRREFQVRCGVNSGYVYFDDSIPLEEISDRVIDIAAHIQKRAKPNTVCVAKPAIEPMNSREGFEPAGTVVEGYEIYEWKKSEPVV